MKFVNESIEEFVKENMGAPMATLTNTPGMGNAVPPSSTSLGSGDKWGNSIGTTKKKRKVYKKTKKIKENFYPSIQEESINPHDKLGVAVAKKMKVPVYFKKGKNQTTHQKKVSK